MIPRQYLYLCGLAALCLPSNAIVNVTIYNTDRNGMTEELQKKFTDAVSAEAEAYCNKKDTKCPQYFQKENLTTKIDDIIESKPNVNLTITIVVKDDGDDEKLPESHVVEIFNKSSADIESKLGDKQILSCNDLFFGITPDNPTNWIMISIFLVFTFVLLGVVVYLSKHKVNHAEEHYTEMKVRETSSADGEIAA